MLLVTCNSACILKGKTSKPKPGWKALYGGTVTRSMQYLGQLATVGRPQRTKEHAYSTMSLKVTLAPDIYSTWLVHRP